MANIVFKVPDASTPGYLRRQRRTLEMQERLRNEPGSVKLLDDLIEFMLDFVVEPDDRDEAREALFDLSEDDYNDMLNSLSGGGSENPIPKASMTAS